MSINLSTLRPGKWSILAGIAGILLIAYLWYLRNSYCQTCSIQNASTSISSANASTNSDVTAASSLLLFSNFVFFKSSDKLENPKIDKEMKGLLAAINADENGSKKILLTGKYRKDEGNSTSFKNVGLARAEAVKSFLVKNGIAEGRIFTKGVETSELWKPDYRDRIIPALPTGNPMSYSFVTSPPLSIIDGTNLNITGKNNFVFPEEKEHFKSLASEVDAALKQTADYLKNHTNRQMVITGYYDESEKDIEVDGFKDLGFARAEDVKNKILEYGGESLDLRVGTASEMNPLFFEKGDLSGGISFDFSSFGEEEAKPESTEDGLTSTTETSVSEAKDYNSILAKPLKLYFNTSKQTVNITSVERNYISDLIAYVSMDGKRKIYIEGHTDNMGKASQNLRLSRKRAEYVKGYLMENGVNESRIVVSYKGQETPMVNNDTPENRALNRRVELSFKK